MSTPSLKKLNQVCTNRQVLLLQAQLEKVLMGIDYVSALVEVLQIAGSVYLAADWFFVSCRIDRFFVRWKVLLRRRSFYCCALVIEALVFCGGFDEIGRSVFGSLYFIYYRYLFNLSMVVLNI